MPRRPKHSCEAHVAAAERKTMNSRDSKIPKVIWILWYQGLTEAPFPVQKCVDSWQRENPGWDIIVLTSENLNDYVTVEPHLEKLSKLSLTKQSNWIRSQLLLEHGGVWVDATTYCMKPLDDWLDECTASGFFAFEKPGPDRIMASWFMTAEKNSPIILKLRDAYVSFFLENDFKNEGVFRRLILKLLYRVLNINEKLPRLWLSPFVTKVLKVFPYFIFHYLFERLVSTDLECREIWNRTKKVDAKPLFRLQAAGKLTQLSESIKAEIDERRMPMYKLSWKTDYSNYDSSTALYYMLERSQN